ncbi:hypothetical protein AKG98_3517 [Moritella sp. JT01]|nr:hypothetical protein AKG98_3517 [Moritella sp. JT01]
MFLPNATAAFQSEMSKGSFTSFINNIHSLLDKIVQRIELHPIHREHDTEDRTTIEIVNALNFLGETCEHEASYGGNCDITSNYQNRYLWLAEAKIDYSNTHIMEGFRQLVDRYSTASRIQKQGSLLIYCKDKAPHEVLKAWKKYFFDKDSSSKEYSINLDSENDRSFVTSHRHHQSDKVFVVKHEVISLFDNATDKSARKKKKCAHTCLKCCPASSPSQ